MAIVDRAGRMSREDEERMEKWKRSGSRNGAERIEEDEGRPLGVVSDWVVLERKDADKIAG